MDDRVDTMQTVTWHVAGWSVGAPSPSGLDWQVADHGLPEDEADLDFYARQDRRPAW